MPERNSPDITTTAGAAESEPERLARHAAVLRRLTEITLQVAEALGRQAAAEAARESAADEAAAQPPGASRSAALGTAVAQVARAVRQSVALEARLHRDQEAHSYRWTPQRNAAAENMGWRRREVRERARTLIATKAPPAERERLYDSLDERLDDLADDAAWLPRSAQDWIGWLRRDMGLDAATILGSATAASAAPAGADQTPPTDQRSATTTWPRNPRQTPHRPRPAGTGVVKDRSD